MMKALLICGAVLAVLYLLGRLRVSVRAMYQASGPAVWLRVGPFNKQLVPAPPKKEKEPQKPKPPKKDKKKEPAPEPETVKEKVGGALDYAKTLLPLVLEAAAQFKRKLQVDFLRLELTAGAPDPADAAMIYGHAMAILGTFWYPITEAFRVKDGTARVNLDFNSGSMAVFADITLSLNLGQILWLGLYFGIKGLRSFLSVRSQHKKQDEQVRKAA